MTNKDLTEEREERGGTRRDFLKIAASGAAAVTMASPDAAEAMTFDLDTFLQKHFRKMSDDELEELIQRLEKKYEKKYGKEFNVKATGPVDDVLFAYGLDVSRCIGCRKCVHACVEENNQSRDPEVQWIRVLEFERDAVLRGVNLEDGDPYFENPVQPAPDKMYLPVACMHCENSPCTNVCPTGATWEEPDGIVAIDYDWCIGCRYCIAACPYGARHFNWSEPTLTAEDINPDIHILGNKPRTKGVVEKCHWCMQRTREGRYPACLEACPVGARKFGNMLDPNSEIRYVMEHKQTFVLKAELGTKPKFFYFF